MKNKIIIALMILVIAVGVIVSVTVGFNLGFNYGSSRKLIVDFKENFEIADVENMIKDVFKDKEFEVKYTDRFEAGITITVKDATDEEITELENKLKEKYPSFNQEEQTETDVEEEEEAANKTIQVYEMASVKIYDIIKDYIKPIIISVIITLVVFAVVFRKSGIIASVVLPAIMIFEINALYVSIISIIRIPVNEYVISIGLLVYAMSLIGTCIYMKFEK